MQKALVNMEKSRILWFLLKPERGPYIAQVLWSIGRPLSFARDTYRQSTRLWHFHSVIKDGKEEFPYGYILVLM